MGKFGDIIEIAKGGQRAEGALSAFEEPGIDILVRASGPNIQLEVVSSDESSDLTLVREYVAKLVEMVRQELLERARNLANVDFEEAGKAVEVVLVESAGMERVVVEVEPRGSP